MATKDWKKDEGMESPGWYNISFTNKKNGKEIVLSNSSDKYEGTNHANSQWTVGLDFPEGEQINFPNKTKALAYAKSYMRKN